jgi:hypothetical protein
MGRGRFFFRFDLSEILASNVERQKERKNKQNEQTERESSQTQTIEIKIKHSKDGEEDGSVEKRKKKHYRNLKKSEQQFFERDYQAFE